MNNAKKKYQQKNIGVYVANNKAYRTRQKLMVEYLRSLVSQEQIEEYIRTKLAEVGANGEEVGGNGS